MQPVSSQCDLSSDGNEEQRANARVLLERERRRHLALRAILIDQIARSRDLDGAEDHDAAARGEDSTFVARLLQRHQAELAAIAGALQRLRRGTYGSCERCGEPIGHDRLEVMPAAEHCIGCAEGRRPPGLSVARWPPRRQVAPTRGAS